MNYIPYYQRKQLVVAYDEMIQQKIDEGWQPHFISFMFNKIPGKPATSASRT
jgi:hypothetical protein